MLARSFFAAMAQQFFSAPPKCQEPCREPNDQQHPCKPQSTFAGTCELPSRRGYNRMDLDQRNGDDQEEQEQGDGDVEGYATRRGIDSIRNLTENQLGKNRSQRNGCRKGDGG